jgi:hypothetical protein
MTQDLTTTSILALFETNKEQRQSFALDLVSKIEQGEVDPLKIHLLVKAMEDIIKLLNDNTIYKKAILEAAQSYGEKSFTFQNAKVEIKEVGVKYDFSKTGDTVWEMLDASLLSAKNSVKQREDFLKTVPLKGMQVLDELTGEMITVYPPSKSSTTSIAVTLK